MLYLSRLILNLSHPLVRRDLADCYQMHRTILSGFPQAPAGRQAREHFGVLYRAEPNERSPTLLRVLVQSQHAPDWSHLRPGTLGPTPDERGNPAVRQIDREYAQLQPGMDLVFRLRANPAKRLSNRTPGRDDPLVGKRVALLREEEQLAWLTRQGERCGFQLLHTEVQPEVPDVRVTAQTIQRGWRPEHGAAPTMLLHFGAVLFQGQLHVNDADQFRETLTQGIGSGKAFGFGLLSVATR